ncbi:MAG: tRNA (adenosine(37)-N6)-threonylcarbamoyltransferase complex dimerization subunit type 1 TsaB [Nannocystaceae bacterium]
MSDWLIGFDTSTPRMLVVLGRPAIPDQQPHGRVLDTGANQASSELVPAIEAMLSAAGLERSVVSAVACGCGPGTFTGTRVAIATAMGLALGLAARVYPLSTLATLAASTDRDGVVWAMLDARRGEVYAAPFRCEDGHVTPLREPVCATMDRVIREYGDEFVPDHLVGTPVELYTDTLPHAWRARAHVGHGPSTVGLWRAILSCVATTEPIDPAQLRPTYLRESYAEMGLNKPKRPVTHSPFV